MPFELEPVPDPVVDVETNLDLAAQAGLNPDAEGRFADLSQRTGIAPDLLRAAPVDYVSRLAHVKTRGDVLRRQADIAEWMANDPTAALVAQDDLVKLERAATLMPYFRALAQTQPTGKDRFRATARGIAQAPITGLGYLGRSIYGLLWMGADAVGAEGVSAYAADKASISAELPAHIQARISGISVGEALADQERDRAWNVLRTSIGNIEISPETVGAAFVSLVPSLLGGAFGIAGTAAAAGAQGAGSSYAEARERGDSGGKAGAVALTSGILTALITRYVPGADQALVRMLRMAPNKAETARAVFAQAIGRTAAQEFTQEGLDEFAQTMLMDLSGGAGFGETLSLAIQNALGAGLIGSLVGGTVGVGEARMAARIQSAETFHAKSTELAAALDETQTLTRSRAVMQSFLQNGGMKDAAFHLDPEDAARVMKGDADVQEALADAGLTAETLAAAKDTGRSISLSAEKVFTLPAAVRDAVIESGRQTPNAMNKRESEIEKAAVRPDEARREFAAEMRKQESRIIKEIKAAQAVDDTVARQQAAPLFAFARAMFAANPGAAKTPTEMLRKVRFNRQGMTQDEVRQAIVDMAGPQGKTALAGLTFGSLGQAIGRFDSLTGQLTVAADDTISLAEVLTKTREVSKDFKGVKVVIDDMEVDAGQAVGTLRSRVEALRRLALCLN